MVLNGSQDGPVPSNRPHLDRATKVDEILEAAEQLLLRDGYESTTMAAIARAAGVATNSIYWYFPGKDEVLAAVLQRRLGRMMERIDADSGASISTRMSDALADLDEGANLTATVHERAKHSTAVATAHQAFHDAIGVRVVRGFRAAGLPEAEAVMAGAAVVAVVEGIHLHEPERDPDARNRLVLWIFNRLTAAPEPR